MTNDALRTCTHSLVALLFVVSLGAADWYASPAVSLGGNGSIASPWPLSTAFSQSTIHAGDTLWLRAGTASGTFTIALSGTSALPIVIRNYNNERAIIDGVLRLGSSTNLWVWGIEIIDSLKASRSDPFDTISGGGIGTKFINCLIHDCCIGLGGGPYEAYGNVMWYCGKTSREHPIYWQNNGVTPKYIKDNLIGYTAGFGIHSYSSAGQLNGLNIIGNAVWGSGFINGSPKAEILLGGGQPVTNCVIKENNCYSHLGRGIQLGYGVANNNVDVQDNYVVGEMAVQVQQPFTSLTFRNNTVITNYHSCMFSSMATLTGNNSLWNSNRYVSWYSNWANQFASVNGAWMSFAAWKASSGVDSTSTYGNTLPADSVVVRPNVYENGRGHVIVWNWSNAASASVNLSTILATGDSFEIRSAYNYFATPIVTGVFTGAAVSIPMTSQVLASVLYWTPSDATPNFSQNFSAFVVRRLSSSGAPAGTLALSSATYTQIEGNSGTSTATITVTRTGGSAGAAGVSYATAQGTATAGGDYTDTSNTLAWANGDAASKTFTVTIAGDTTDESDETVALSLSTPTGGAALGTSSATLTITNDDALPPGTTGGAGAGGSGSGGGCGLGSSLIGLLAMLLCACRWRRNGSLSLPRVDRRWS